MIYAYPTFHRAIESAVKDLLAELIGGLGVPGGPAGGGRRSGGRAGHGQEELVALRAPHGLHHEAALVELGLRGPRARTWC